MKEQLDILISMIKRHQNDDFSNEVHKRNVLQNIVEAYVILATTIRGG